MPDIDIDFSVRGRERVMRYVTEKYGRESVAQIVTFGKMFPRAATRDAARVLGHDYGIGDRLAKLIPDPIMGRAPSFEDCLKAGQPLRKAYDEEPTAKQIIDVAQGLEGIVRNSSIHAAAVVIADRPLTDIVPLQLADAGTDENGERVFRTVTQFSMKPIEEIGLLKMDFLGLRNLDVIEDALDIIERSTRRAPGHDDAAARRPATYEMLARGRLHRGVPVRVRGHARGAQEGAPGRVRRPRRARRAVPARARWTRSRSTRKGKRNPEAISYPDERLRPILESSKGVILYQEQAMQISKELAGFSGAKADDLRKAIGKKNRAAMATLKPEFVRGLPRLGHAPRGDRLPLADQREVGRLLVQQEPRRLLRADRLPDRLAEGQPPRRVHGGADLLGDVDEGQGPVLRRPLRGDGDRDPAARRQPLRPRVHGRRAATSASASTPSRASATRRSRRSSARATRAGAFTSLWDFCERVDSRTVNKKAIEALIKCGALGSTGASRKGMLEVLEQAQAAGQKAQQDALIGQGSIFDLQEQSAGAAPPAAPAARPGAPGAPADPRRRSSTSPSCWRSRRRRSACSSPRIR